ncbi:MAG: hypothetical protein KA801_06495 [Syntrophorhabdaceae bacterium]|nr:hypothetical protein [Syntrophorhabdaceae bacterium]
MKNTTPDEMVRSALATGKISPDREQWARDYATRDPKGFEVFVNKAVAVPVVKHVPVKERKIDETQRMINALFGVDDETFRKYAVESEEGRKDDTDETQRIINRLFGIEESRPRANESALDETQRQINSLCGVDDETYLKHGGR